MDIKLQFRVLDKLKTVFVYYYAFIDRYVRLKYNKIVGNFLKI